jgi:hypothetical protein
MIKNFKLKGYKFQGDHIRIEMEINNKSSYLLIHEDALQDFDSVCKVFKEGIIEMLHNIYYPQKIV